MGKCYGILATRGYQLRLEQWVAVYHLDRAGQPNFWLETTVRELNTTLAKYPLQEFLIEPITSSGQPISLREAVLPIYHHTIEESCPIELICPVNAAEVCPNYGECRKLEPVLTGNKFLREQVLKLE